MKTPRDRHLMRAVRATSCLSSLCFFVADSERRWSERGDSFVILDVEQLCERVLPKYYKHQKFSSFCRQLNLYRCGIIEQIAGAREQL